MAVQEIISVEDYLSRSYEGAEPEYVDGQLVERAMPGLNHSDVIARLHEIFLRDDLKRCLTRGTELRLRLSPTRVRIVDFCLYEAKPMEQVPTTPPLVTIEVLSPDDRFLEVETKLAEYHAWGVPHVWLADPSRRQLYSVDNGRLHAVDEFSLPQYDLTIDPESLFAGI